MNPSPKANRQSTGGAFILPMIHCWGMFYLFFSVFLSTLCPCSLVFTHLTLIVCYCNPYLDVWHTKHFDTPRWKQSLFQVKSAFNSFATQYIKSHICHTISSSFFNILHKQTSHCQPLYCFKTCVIFQCRTLLSPLVSLTLCNSSEHPPSPH